VDLNEVLAWLDERYRLIDEELERAFRFYRAAFDAQAIYRWHRSKARAKRRGLRVVGCCIEASGSF